MKSMKRMKPRDFRDDRMRMRIPGRDGLARLARRRRP